MEITEVRVRPVEEPKLKAWVSVTFDSVFVVHQIRIIDNGPGGLRVFMPARRMPDGTTFKDYAHPLNKEFRKKIEDTVVEAYKAKLAEGQNASDHN